MNLKVAKEPLEVLGSLILQAYHTRTGETEGSAYGERLSGDGKKVPTIRKDFNILGGKYSNSPDGLVSCSGIQYSLQKYARNSPLTENK